MESKLSTIVDLRDLAHKGESRELTLNDDFFAGLEQNEIIGGEVSVRLCVKERAAEVFELHLDIDGTVRVACDRCLEDLTLACGTSDVVKVYAGDSDGFSDHAEMKVLTGRGFEYDAAWDIYELIVVSLPMQRVHETGECNEDMLSRISTDDDVDDIEE